MSEVEVVAGSTAALAAAPLLAIVATPRATTAGDLPVMAEILIAVVLLGTPLAILATELLSSRR
jgi:hypothetical protein